MTTNFKGDGKTILKTVSGSAVVGGAPFIAGNLLAVYASDAAVGAKVAAHIQGAHTLPAVSADVIAQGEKVKFDHTGLNVRAAAFAGTTGDLIGCGVCLVAKGSGETTVTILLTPGVATVQ